MLHLIRIFLKFHAVKAVIQHERLGNVTNIERKLSHTMGLSASQARLLTVTARKSDCEYESMRLSHQKLALSRDMNNVSAEYQDSINQTKLMYDFYGNGSREQQLSYNLLMSPSALNDYIPSPITDTSGRVVLNPGLARAAKAAGIPQEGLDGLPSSDQRNKFIDGMAANGVISEKLANDLKLTKYNQSAGVGSADLINVNTTETTYTGLLSMLNGVKFDFSDLVADAGGSNLNIYIDGVEQSKSAGVVTGDLSLADILNGNVSVRGMAWDNEDLRGKDGLYDFSVVDKVATCSFWSEMETALKALLDTGDPYTQAALEYAGSKVNATIECLSSPEGADWSNAAFHDTNRKRSSGKIMGWINKSTDKYIGYMSEQNSGDSYNDGYGLNLTNMAKAYLTYFAQYMEGISNSSFNVEKTVDQSTLIDDLPFTFEVVTGIDVSGDNLLIAGFYDTLFNQICTKGWTENENVDDPAYLQEMLQNGSMYISTMSDDGFYYQGNYATNTYIKEVTDEEAIAQAEAKYNREKEKLNYKENILDMKMKNLDTEISALTTEYDTVKSVIQKNIEKSFKRYSA